jgi:Tol biopolymer transport system component/tRNA A-37 threonylcarbamoyl transferase component Bud32
MTFPPGALSAALADRYAIERELGQGGMATVYLAQDLKHRRRVAVKVLRPDLAATLGSDRFFREIEVAAQLQHPHILPLLDSGEAGGFLYYVMPFIDGESLRERLARHGELPVNDAIRILSEVVDALAAAHAAGVVHRDIKPDNIMLSGRHALVMDFGVAKAVSEATGRNQLTTAGVALGTPAYMAPEQAAADPHLDHRVDIYAVGVLAYELLTGRPPFIGLTPQQVLAAHVTQPPEPVERYRPGIPQGLSDVVMRCLAKRPADRWQSADHLVNALEPLAMSSGGMTPTQTRPIAAVRAPPRQFPRWAAWLAGGMLVAAGAFALSLRQDRPEAISLGQRTPVAMSDDLERWPALTPDGEAVLYTRWGASNAAIVIQQVGGGAPMVVQSGTAGPMCCQAISPDGTRLLFSQQNGIYVMPTLGGQPRRIADAPPPGSAWSPDGGRIAFAPSFDSLVVMGINGSGRQLIARGRELHSPAWSSDGAWIAFVEGNVEFHLDGNVASSAIMVVPASGGEIVNVTGRASHNTSPVWVPGGRSLLFISDREGGRDIYEQRIDQRGRPNGVPLRITTGLNPERIAISANGKRVAWSTISAVSNVRMLQVPGGDSVALSTATPVTTGTQNIESARISPDGAWLYFDSDRSGNSDIWRIPLAGGTAEQLTNDPAPEFQPQISPDGRLISFHSIRSEVSNRDVFVQPLAGGPAIQVSTSPGNDRSPAWAPDGNALAWMDNFAPDSALLVSHRRADGSWLPARRYATPPFSSDPVWDADGRVEMHYTNGVSRIDSATGAWTSVLDVPLAPTGLGKTDAGGQRAWSSDGRTLFFFTYGAGNARIAAFHPPDTTRRTVAWSDHPSQVTRFSLAFKDGRLYFPLAELRMDVWVADLRE